MADLTAKKSDYLSKVVLFAEQLMAVTLFGEELANYQTANGFQSGGANAVVDVDALGANVHLTAALANAVVTVAGDLASAMNVARRTTLRQAGKAPQV